MAWTNIISEHTFAIGMVLVGCFCIWKFIIEPIQNEGQPIHENELDEPSQ